jgi:hypothetical protein
MILDSILVYGVENRPNNVVINKINHDNYLYDDIHKVSCGKILDFV